MPLYRDKGVVLRSIKLGEADRIVTIFSQGHGKVRAVAKGVRKTTSRFGGRLEPTSHIAFQCYEGRELDVITQVETIDSFRNVREGYSTLTHAISMLEAIDQFAHQDREPIPPLYRMLVGALGEMNERPSPLIAPAFFWKLLSIEGFHPILDHCARCGRVEVPYSAFDVAEGGVVCEECSHIAGIRVTPQTIELLGKVVGGELNQALALVLNGDSEAVGSIHELEHLALASLEFHLERRLRSAPLL